jgi:hypothetical protein
MGQPPNARGKVEHCFDCALRDAGAIDIHPYREATVEMIVCGSTLVATE